MEFLKHMKVKDEWKHSNLAIFNVYVIHFSGEYLIEVEIEFDIIYIYMYTYIHTYVRTYVHTYIHTYILDII